jgi:hypothetical protein
MRLLVALALVLVVVLFVTGAIYFRRDDGKVEIIVDTQKIEAQAEKVAKRVVQKGKQALEEARDKLEQAEAEKTHGSGR